MPVGKVSVAISILHYLAEGHSYKRRLGVADGREVYDCALSFGVGASLGGERFLATRLLGRTQVWRDEPAR